MTNIVTEATKTVSQVGDFFTAANLTLAAIIIFGGYLLKFTSKIKSYTSITEDIEELKESIGKISDEFKNNGGSSLKDQIDKLTKSTDTILYRQRWILDNRQEPIFETDEQGNFTWVNDSLTRLTDRTFRELKGNNWINCLEESSRAKVSDSWHSAIDDKRNFEQELEIVDNKNRHFSAKCIATRQEDGKYIGTFSGVRLIN
jgi:PAS domain S-box-containing protein